MNILGKILEAVLKPKFEKEANKIINSEEYQNTLKEMAYNTDEMVRLTAKLKDKVDAYNIQIKKFQKDGIKVKTGDTPTQMKAAYDKWQKEQHEEFWKKHPEAINNPLIKKMLDYKL